MNDVFAYRSSVQVQLGVGGRQVGLEVDPDTPETPQVVEQARRVELPEHLLKIGLKQNIEKKIIQVQMSLKYEMKEIKP